MTDCHNTAFPRGEYIGEVLRRIYDEETKTVRSVYRELWQCNECRAVFFKE